MKKRLICFIHIEKAAGTTIHHILANNFQNYLTLSPTFYWSNEPGNSTNEKELAWIMRFTLPTEAIGGHPLRNYHPYEAALKRPLQFVTFVREPISRYVSHFKHQKFAKHIKWTIDSFLDESRFNNYMTRRISPTANLEEAKTILSKQMAFVGIMEHFDESLLLMKHELSLKSFTPFYEKENVSKSDFTEQKMLEDPKILDRIIKNNSDDIELYRFVKEELYPTYKETYSGSLEKEMKEFRLRNTNYKFSQALKLRARLYRLLYYKPIQYFFKFLLH